VRGIAEDTGTSLELDLPEGLYAEVDPRRVERIVRNLVANAVDHGEGRPVHVRVAADDDTVAVLVRDHGVGLRPGEAGLVFNRFWRAEESRARRSGGSGLGLSISIEDARLHGGWLQAWGAPGEGSAFRLTLPRETGGTVRASPLPLGPDAGTAAVRAGSVPTPPRDRPSVGAGDADRSVGWTGGWSLDDDGDAGPDDDGSGGGDGAGGVGAGRAGNGVGNSSGDGGARIGGDDGGAGHAADGATTGGGVGAGGPGGVVR
jgi:hypothetical protein